VEAGLDDCDDDLLLEDELDDELEDELEGGLELLDCSVSGGLHAVRDKNSTASAGIDHIPFSFCIVSRRYSG